MADMRAAILAIQADASLTEAEKARRRQDLFAGKWAPAPAAGGARLAAPPPPSEPPLSRSSAAAFHSPSTSSAKPTRPLPVAPRPAGGREPFVPRGRAFLGAGLLAETWRQAGN